jgi:hypothetical protein
MEIKPLYNDNEFDVFIGNGWENWLRVTLDHSKRQAAVEGFLASHVEVTPKLLELIYYKCKKFQVAERRANETFKRAWERGELDANGNPTN